MKSMRVKVVALVMAGALVFVACGDNKKSSKKASTGTKAAAVKTDFGTTATKIRVGLLADLSGPFAALVKDIVLAQQVYFDRLNKAGGIAGRQIELAVEDTKYDVPTHKQKFAAMAAKDASGVLMISQSTGSPHTASIAKDLEADSLIAIPLSWYSGWADPAFGKNVFEAYTNYCLEGMNVTQFIKDQGGKKIALVTFPGEYGQDGAAGVKQEAKALGLPIAYDGEGKVIPPSATNPNPDVSAVVQSIVSSGADWVYASVNPTTLARLMGGAAAKGYKGKWTGASPSYADQLLKSDAKNLIDSSWYQSNYAVALGTNVPGMSKLVDAIKTDKPDARASDAYVYGWTEAEITEAVLKKAAGDGDLTRAGVVKAAFELDKVDFGGLAPAQSWKGDPNSYIVRESYMFKPKLSLYKEGTLAGGASTGLELVKGPFASDLAKNYDFKGPCFKPAA
jgi:ABC-type branched-subunit amino acid transport system substrate-binding protein